MMKILSTFVAIALAASAAPAFAEDSAADQAERHAKKDEAMKDANGAIKALKSADPSLSRLFGNAAGYAVFANVGKGGAGIGGAQLGGQAYSEVIFFDTKEAVADFRKGEFAMAAQVSAVAVKAGASANAKYEQGVAVFTLSKGGLMAEASIGGQKFSYEPFAS